MGYALRMENYKSLELGVVKAGQWRKPGDTPHVNTCRQSVRFTCSWCDENIRHHGQLKENPRMSVCPTDWIVEHRNGHISVVSAEDFFRMFERMAEIKSVG